MDVLLGLAIGVAIFVVIMLVVPWLDWVTAWWNPLALVGRYWDWCMDWQERHRRA